MKEPRGGYTGRTLRVDLGRGTLVVEPTPDLHAWLGPRGWNARVGWREVGPGVGPFDPGNRIVFSVGPLVGTGAPTAGRTVVSTLAPRGYPTPMWASATVGGYLGAELKFAGYDSIIIHGRAESPCYLQIEDDHISLEDASEIWGQGVFGTQQALKARHSQDHQVAAIGPAGENRVRFASISHRLNNAIGNSGFGGVMGAKNLKAIAVRGTGGVTIADPIGFLDAMRKVTSLIEHGLLLPGPPRPGPVWRACSHGCTARCFTRMHAAADRYDTGAKWNVSTCNDGRWARERGRHTAYEGTSVTGQKLFVPGVPGFGQVGLDLANLAEDMGMTRWAYQAWGQYLGALQHIGIDKICGEPFQIDRAEWWHDWILDVAHRRGLGDDFAEGLARFYDKHQIGPRYLAEFLESAGSRGHGWHREGRLMEGHPSPYWEHSALLYAVSTRDVTPSTHGFFFINDLYGYPDAPISPDDMPAGLKALSKKLYGSEEAVYPGDTDVEQVTVWHQHRAIVKDSMGVCDWKYPVIRKPSQDWTEDGDEEIGDVEAEALLFRACTGIDMDIGQMHRPIAERIINLERCIEVRNTGRSRELDEAVIPHYQWPEKTDGTHLSSDASEFRNLLDRYYDLRGWDRVRGWPTRQKLVELGLGEAAEVLEALRGTSDNP